MTAVYYIRFVGWNCKESVFVNAWNCCMQGDAIYAWKCLTELGETVLKDTKIMKFRPILWETFEVFMLFGLFFRKFGSNFNFTLWLFGRVQKRCIAQMLRLFFEVVIRPVSVSVALDFLPAGLWHNGGGGRSRFWHMLGRFRNLTGKKMLVQDVSKKKYTVHNMYVLNCICFFF